MRAQRVLVILTCLSLLPLTAYGLTLPGRTLVCLMKSSDCVVHGVVEAVEAADSRQPLATVTVTPREVLKGTVDTEGLSVSVEAVVSRSGEVGTPEWEAIFTPGEEVVVFLTRLADGRIVVTGGVEGKFTQTEAEDGTAVIRSAVGPIPVAGLTPENRPKQLPTSEFLEYLRSIAAYPQ